VTKVRRYKRHSAGSARGWPFPTLKYNIFLNVRKQFYKTIPGNSFGLRSANFSFFLSFLLSSFFFCFTLFSCWLRAVD